MSGAELVLLAVFSLEAILPFKTNIQRLKLSALGGPTDSLFTRRSTMIWLISLTSEILRNFSFQLILSSQKCEK